MGNTRATEFNDFRIKFKRRCVSAFEVSVCMNWAYKLANYITF